ncbi:MAG: response regulator [Phenylobacterium sp.]|uniref:response regulator n=1 Tax=Phenylobacterium sp. TaxID=1871053 RepID=UPI0025F9DAC3|nr:response regulator [Phenylobacterium sp.]MCG9917308.1 response regulator [Phenylobacterium sp.]
MKTRPLILLVDDDVTLLQTIGTQVRLAGFDAVLSSSAVTAIQVLKDQPIDLVIMDLFMPDRDGIETITDIRMDWPDLPIIAMSGGWRTIGADTVLDMALAIGAQSALAKPFDRATLVAAIEAALSVD